MSGSVSRMQPDGTWKDVAEVQLAPWAIVNNVFHKVGYGLNIPTKDERNDLCSIDVQSEAIEKEYYDNLIRECYDLRFSSVENQRKYCRTIYSNSENVDAAIIEFDKEHKGYLSESVYNDMIDKIRMTFQYKADQKKRLELNTSNSNNKLV